VVTFTGSAHTGMMLKAHPKIIQEAVPFNMEADSLNCMVLGNDVEPGQAEWDLFIKEVKKEMTVKAGQKCTAIRRIFVPENKMEDVWKSISSELDKTVIGNPTNEERFHYTLVLKTHLKLLDSYLPKNTYMHQLNSIARYILWQKKLDFSHGLGHGVSNCIDVHESPYSINNRCAELLTENIILSNEPGLYFENQYGIRIENLMYSKIINNNVESKKQFIKFENLTMIPYETKLIEKSMIDEKEIIQINNSHV
jgi:hypothetical protein